MVKNLPSKGGDSSSIPDQGTEVPHAEGAAEPLYTRACVLQRRLSTAQNLKKKKKNDVISFWLGRVSSLES